VSYKLTAGVFLSGGGEISVTFDHYIGNEPKPSDNDGYGSNGTKAAA
jgi:hypothetical protein